MTEIIDIRDEGTTMYGEHPLGVLIFKTVHRESNLIEMIGHCNPPDLRATIIKDWICKQLSAMPAQDEVANGSEKGTDAA